MSSEKCFHCGDKIVGKEIIHDNKSFCCSGCKSVFILLQENGLDGFYSMEPNSGTKPINATENNYGFLEIDSIRKKYIEYEDDSSVHVTLFIPSIHCSSCIYLLENLPKINPLVISSTVNFTKRQASIVFSQELKLSELAHLLDAIGYAPNFSNADDIKKKRNNSFLFKLGISAFAFGSIMLWSFPEYLGVEGDNPEFRSFTSWLSFAVSIPVLLYSANEYLISAWKAIKFKTLNLDVPISLGILALYGQSTYSILTNEGPGYMDSFAGFIFFLLIGKWFQNKTYDTLSFDRDYRSYFPVAVTKWLNNEEETIEIDALNEGDLIVIRNHEIIPCDSTLVSDECLIDYSFVTGESLPVTKKKGDFIYAGGKLIGGKRSLKVEKKSSRSHLTQLWNDGNKKDRKEQKSDKLSVYFLIAVLVISGISGIVWGIVSANRATEIVVAVLIVACPCALALSKPFTYGNTMRKMGMKGLYLKNVTVIESLNEITDIVFDKTGTLTSSDYDQIHFQGDKLNNDELNSIYSMVSMSTHPLSRSVADHLGSTENITVVDIEDFIEISGNGIRGKINNMDILLGNSSFVGFPDQGSNETTVHVSINGAYKGKYIFLSEYRNGIFETLQGLSENYSIHVVSGDSQKERDFLREQMPYAKTLLFEQKPIDKKDFIHNLENQGAKVLMIGDGLNDAGALENATAGIAVSENIFSFTPGSDAIIDAKSLSHLGDFLQTSAWAKTVLKICFGFSILYNVVGLSFAVSGHLTPLIAAILMPISSITIVIISTSFIRLAR